MSAYLKGGELSGARQQVWEAKQQAERGQRKGKKNLERREGGGRAGQGHAHAFPAPSEHAMLLHLTQAGQSWRLDWDSFAQLTGDNYITIT